MQRIWVSSQFRARLIRVVGVAAIVLPLNLPSPTSLDIGYLNQILSVLLFALLLLAATLEMRPVATHTKPTRASRISALVFLAAIGCVCIEAREKPTDAATLLLAVFVGMTAARATAVERSHGFCSSISYGFCLTGLFAAAIAIVQFLNPGWIVTDLLVVESATSRAIGNMRQPNHFATALVCSIVWTSDAWQRGKLRGLVAAPLIVVMILAVALSASRTGATAIGLLTLWAAFDTRLRRCLRRLLFAAPLIYFAFWFGLAEWARLQHGSYFGVERLHSKSDLSSSRFGIWSNAFELIGQQPWTGVGWGKFNAAWTFTPLPERSIHFFNHTHNLPLQLAVEVGLPLTVILLGSLGALLWCSRSAWRASSIRDRPSPRAALAMLAVLGLHSLLEYPLWYAYFLLPGAWALGVFVGSAQNSTKSSNALSFPPGTLVVGQALLVCAGSVMVGAAVYAASDHRRVERALNEQQGDAPLAARIASGQRSFLFGHHADYAAAISGPLHQPVVTFRRPLLELIDVRLLIAYIEAQRAAGDNAKALYAAQRLREFRRPDAQAYFSGCNSPAPPFQCTREPVGGMTWRDMLPP